MRAGLILPVLFVVAVAASSTKRGTNGASKQVTNGTLYDIVPDTEDVKNFCAAVGSTAISLLLLYFFFALPIFAFEKIRSFIP